METDPEPPTKRRRVYIVGAIAAACLITLVLVWLWGRGVFENGPENLSTTTDPFAHVDRNQPVDDVTIGPTPTPTVDATGSPADTMSRPQNWTYWTSFDQVRNATIYHAVLTSENSAFFDFPYQGGSTLTLTVRKHPAYGNDVIFKISKGQFVCGVDNCSGTINFGSGPEPIALSEATDNSSDTLFAVNGDEIIGHLKTAKKVVVELPFYQEGSRQFTFESTAPLRWQTATPSTEDTTTVDEASEDRD